LCLVNVIVWSLFVATVASADLTGGWTLEFHTPGSQNVYSGVCAFKQEGERLAGSCGSGPTTPVPVTGTLKGSSATFQFKTGLDAGLTVVFSGRLDEQETSIKGAWRSVDQDGNMGEGIFTATKQ